MIFACSLGFEGQDHRIDYMDDPVAGGDVSRHDIGFLTVDVTDYSFAVNRKGRTQQCGDRAGPNRRHDAVSGTTTFDHVVEQDVEHHFRICISDARVPECIVKGFKRIVGREEM